MSKSEPAPQGAADEPRPEGRVVTTPLPPAKRGKKALLVGAAAAAIAGLLTRNAPEQGDLQERRQPQANGRGTRDLSLTPESYDATARTVEAVLSAGTAVRRFYFTEELEISDAAIDLGRVGAGICPLLDTHNQGRLGDVLGRITNVRIEGGQLIGTLEFADTDAGRAIEARVASGELRAISIGYRVTKWQITATDENDHETWRAVAWELLEASLVPVPADPNAVVRSASGTPQHGTTQEEDDMRRNLPGGAAAAAPSAAAPAAPAAPAPVGDQGGAARAEPPSGSVRITARQIRERCARSTDLGSDFALDLIGRNEENPLSEAEFERAISDRLLGQREQPRIDVRVGAAGTDSEDYRRAVEVAVTLRADPSARFDPADVERARELRGLTLMEMSRDYLQRTGISTAGMGRLDIAGAALGLRYGAHTTSDFANALSSATGKRVRQAYLAAPQTFGPLVMTGTLPDFKPTNIIGLGDAPQLLLVQENAEFTYGAMADTGMSYRLQTYGRIIAITRQAIINDDKRLFARVPDKFGYKARDLESDLVWGLVLSNPTMGDGFALFSAQHGNLGTAADINVDSVTAGRTAMGQQKSVEGGFIIVRPAYLVVGPLMETKAEQFLTAVAATQTANVNPFVGSLQLIVEPRITDKSWYLFADKAAIDTIELSHLEGQEDVFIETQPGFDVDGVKTKARLDVGAAIVDYRGMYKNPGL
ncbi:MULTISPECIES: prohead protease/major capsid protein fusion protein [Sphingomonas]|uniref:HK97 family phage prohead protease n=1 Tax=Sphingomonas trueperi TaxID=53317 RepID=A0A7X5Y4Q5_9SPHN|nr:MULTISPECIES: prohead protease/major capsid protein fusion protein [Sphingomonas]NJB99426.1 HK97 family phage prohead protease [Sphingomonas trueperi]